MAAESPWPMIHAERAALAEDLAGLAVVSGPALSLVLAITGRPAALADLSGDGLAMLRSRG